MAFKHGLSIKHIRIHGQKLLSCDLLTPSPDLALFPLALVSSIGLSLSCILYNKTVKVACVHVKYMY